jgi:hypothetical protein
MRVSSNPQISHLGPLSSISNFFSFLIFKALSFGLPILYLSPVLPLLLQVLEQYTLPEDFLSIGDLHSGHILIILFLILEQAVLQKTGPRFI